MKGGPPRDSRPDLPGHPDPTTSSPSPQSPDPPDSQSFSGSLSSSFLESPLPPRLFEEGRKGPSDGAPEIIHSTLDSAGGGGSSPPKETHTRKRKDE